MRDPAEEEMAPGRLHPVASSSGELLERTAQVWLAFEVWTTVPVARSMLMVERPCWRHLRMVSGGNADVLPASGDSVD